MKIKKMVKKIKITFLMLCLMFLTGLIISTSFDKNEKNTKNINISDSVIVKHNFTAKMSLEKVFSLKGS